MEVASKHISPDQLGINSMAELAAQHYSPTHSKKDTGIARK
jgi:hypothetical protein